MSLYRLFYVSTAVPDFHKSDVTALADKAAQRYGKAGITGSLRFNGINFAEVLEGEKADLDALMSEIRADQRHTGVIVIAMIEIEERMFGTWSASIVDGLDFQDFVEAMILRTTAA
ncbi:BLUF domain-containing protein [Pseudohoeflea coraliihabitans]|uniref:BLUF domain-containing protein n=1 Tax=Pseudohoeflea coraliihabitans TaxID=2860393 RepID=A0ABS6WMV6_9HYPH|nr:BLUF domain-containing protein [Pseudohoeflea sp. DP4N28-3]MBW3097292.1 BLUF domain-containing protein [Pseudohoeflea sp. DP4N28-3]